MENFINNIKEKLQIIIPVSSIINYINKKKEKKKEYEWVYDKKFGDCGCKPDKEYLSDPYCPHMNKLIYIEKE